MEKIEREKKDKRTIWITYFNKHYWKGRKKSEKQIEKRIKVFKKTYKKNHPKIKTKCDYCKKIIFRSFSMFKNKKNYFCNRKCMLKFTKRNPYFKGKHHKKETKENQRKVMKKKWENPEYRKTHRGYWLGKHREKGFGKKMKLINSGKKSGMWKGDKAKRCAIHKFIIKHKSKPKWNLCEFCHKRKPYELANMKNHKYTRNPKDYKWLCYKCHLKLDGRLFKLKNKRGKNA